MTSLVQLVYSDISLPHLFMCLSNSKNIGINFLISIASSVNLVQSCSCKSSFLSFFLCVFSRSTRLKAVKSTKRESSSSSWLIWSRTTDGSDTPAALSFSDLGMLFIEQRGVPSPHLLYKNPPRTSTPRLLHVHTPTCSSWNWTEQMTFKEKKKKNGGEEVKQLLKNHVTGVLSLL